MNFSFNYGDKSFTLEVKDGAVYQLENGVSVKVEERIYKEYDATEWVIYFENASDTPSLLPHTGSRIRLALLLRHTIDLH